MSSRTPCLAALLVAALGSAAPSAPAAQLTVGAGSSLGLGTGAVDLGCSDLVVTGTFSGGAGSLDQARDVTIQPGGTLDGGAAILQVTGDWTNSGTFTPGTSLVRFPDGCGQTTSAVTGNSTFYDLTFTSGFGRLVSFAAGSTTTVQNFLDLQGAFDNLLQVRSSIAGVEAFLDLQGGHAADFVDVEDNHATGNTITILTGLVGANAVGWSLDPLMVPALGPLGLGVLGVGLLWLGRRSLLRA